MSVTTREVMRAVRGAADLVIEQNNDQREQGLQPDPDSGEAEMHLRAALTALARNGKP